MRRRRPANRLQQRLSSALHTLTSDVDAAKADPTTATLTTVASSAGAVVAAGKNLSSAVSGTCS